MSFDRFAATTQSKRVAHIPILHTVAERLGIFANSFESAFEP